MNRSLKIKFLVAGFFFLLFSSCTKENSLEVDYTFSVAKNVTQKIEDFDKVKFESFNDLNLGFFRGDIWIKLDIKNTSVGSNSCMFISNDRFNRNYTFYKLDKAANEPKLVNEIKDFSKEDYRTYNSPNPNLKINLAPNEQAVYLITSSSDGRTKDATPKIISLEGYYNFVGKNTIWDIVFYTIIFFLLLINVYLWRIYKRKIYFYYLFYILSTIFVYLGIEGYLLCLKIDQIIIDHFVFISVKLWALSLIMYTSKFLEIDIVAPKYYKFIKAVLWIVLGGTLGYQFLFFYSSIQYLHYFENLLTVLWLIIIVSILILAAKKRWVELKYYLIPLSFFILFTVFGIINVHLQLLEINSFSFVKIGAIFEFIGFTYFTTLLIKRKLQSSEGLRQKLEIKSKELIEKSNKLDELNQLLEQRTSIEKTDLLNIFSLLENSLSKESDWEFFKNKFKELNPNFLNNLIDAHPELSKSEIRLITLIKIGYSQKEIADILNIVPDSVKKARSRVRKKFKLSELINLNEYLEQF